MFFKISSVVYIGWLFRLFVLQDFKCFDVCVRSMRGAAFP